MLNWKELHKLYKWLDAIPLSRVKQNVSKDFSDGCMFAEVMGHFFPEDINLKMYISSGDYNVRKSNWNMIKKILRKHNFHLSDNTINNLIDCKPGEIEQLLYNLRKILKINSRRNSLMKLSISEGVLQGSSSRHHQQYLPGNRVIRNISCPEVSSLESSEFRHSREVVRRRESERTLASVAVSESNIDLRRKILSYADVLAHWKTRLRVLENKLRKTDNQLQLLKQQEKLLLTWPTDEILTSS